MAAAVLCSVLTISAQYILHAAVVGQEDQRQKHAQAEAGVSHAGRGRIQLTTKYYWHRLLGTSLGWFAWDFYYVSTAHPAQLTHIQSTAHI